MKSRLILLFIFVALISKTPLRAQNFWVPDAAFRTILKANYPTCFTAQDSLITNCPNLILDSILYITSNSSLQNLDGLQYMTGLTSLDIWLCQNLSSIPSFPPLLNSIVLYGNSLTTIPALPPTLTELVCSQSNLSALPQLPQTVNWLVVSETALTQLPALPNTLVKLDCSYNQLTTLPAMPDSLRFLYCQNNYGIDSIKYFNSVLQILTCGNFNIQISNLPNSLEELSIIHSNLNSLPNLPPNLTRLECSFNNLNQLPNLPAGLKVLNASYNNISSLPILPDSLKVLLIDNLKLSNLPSLPSKIESMLCSNNNLGILPNLPAKLRYFECYNNPLSCLPNLPDSIFYMDFHNTFISCIPNQPLNLSPFNCVPLNPIVCATTNASCGSYPLVCVNFNDADSNGQKDTTDNPISLMMHFQSSSFQPTQPQEYLTLYADTGLTQVSITVPNYYTASTPSTQSGQVSASPDTLFFGVTPIPGIKDLSIDIIPLTAMRPGFITGYWINYKNEGTDTINNVLVNFIKSPVVTHLSQNPLPTYVLGDTLRWLIPTLVPNQTGFIRVTERVGLGAVLGNIELTQASITPIVADTTPYSNYAVIREEVVGSYDPNDKTVTNDSVLVNTNDYLYYTIRFQNTGSDTAFNIMVTDTLSQMLNGASLVTVSSSHTCNTTIKNNVVSWYFPTILLPDSTINEPASHGFIRFKILKTSGIQAGIQIPNSAAIYFDYNSPVITNTAVVSILQLSIPEISNNQFQLFPNPVHSVVQIKSLTNTNLGVVKLVDINGKLIEEQFVESEMVNWNVKYLPVGAYIFVGKNWRQKIVKQ